MKVCEHSSAIVSRINLRRAGTTTHSCNYPALSGRVSGHICLSFPSRSSLALKNTTRSQVAKGRKLTVLQPNSFGSIWSYPLQALPASISLLQCSNPTVFWTHISRQNTNFNHAVDRAPDRPISIRWCAASEDRNEGHLCRYVPRIADSFKDSRSRT